MCYSFRRVWQEVRKIAEPKETAYKKLKEHISKMNDEEVQKILDEHPVLREAVEHDRTEVSDSNGS
jgi:hypothetical protein